MLQPAPLFNEIALPESPQKCRCSACWSHDPQHARQIPAKQQKDEQSTSQTDVSAKSACTERRRLTENLAAAYSILYLCSKSETHEDSIASIGVSMGGMLSWHNTILMTNSYLQGATPTHRLPQEFSHVAEKVLTNVITGWTAFRSYDWKNDVETLIEDRIDAVKAIDMEMARCLIEVADQLQRE